MPSSDKPYRLVAPAGVFAQGEVPEGLRINREASAGRHGLLEIFSGLEETAPFRRYPGDRERILALAKSTWIRLVDEPGWMYIAPWEVSAELADDRATVVTSSDDEIVIARPYLTTGSDMDLYLDALHESLHILQRRCGRELWPGPDVPYVDRPTEVEAYAFSVAEARRVGASELYLREYLRRDWIPHPDFLRLLDHVGVAPPLD